MAKELLENENLKAAGGASAAENKKKQLPGMIGTAVAAPATKNLATTQNVAPGAVATVNQEQVSAPPVTTAAVPAAAPAAAPTSTPAYDQNTDYAALIAQAAAKGDYAAAAQYERQRNAKITGEGLGYTQTNQYSSYLPGGNDYITGLLNEVDTNDPDSIYAAYEQIISQNNPATDLSGMLNEMYDANEAAQRAQIDQQYAGLQSALDAEKEALAQSYRNQQIQTDVAAKKNQMAFNEVQNALGLSSGAMGQAALARNNQLQSDLTTLRAAKQTAEAEIERQRTTYKEQYTAALQEAVAQNDYERAVALYEEAVRQDEALKAQEQTNVAYVLDYLNNRLAEASAAASGYSGGGGSYGTGASEEEDSTDVTYGTGLDTQSFSNLAQMVQLYAANGMHDKLDAYLNGSTAQQMSKEQWAQILALLD